MAGFNPLKEKIYTFEDATKILCWDSDSLLRKANEGKITPLVYLEWEGNTSISPDPILTPEGESEWSRLSEAGLNISGVTSVFPEALKLNKRMNKRLRDAVSDVAVRCSYFLYVCLRRREWCTTKLLG